MLNAICYFFVSRETFCPGRLDSPNIPPNQMTLLAFSKMQPYNVHPTINVRQTLPIWSFLRLFASASSYPAAPQYSSSKAARLGSHRKSWLSGKVERMVPVILRKAPGTRKLRQTPSPDISPLFHVKLFFQKNTF